MKKNFDNRLYILLIIGLFVIVGTWYINSDDDTYKDSLSLDNKDETNEVVVVTPPENARIDVLYSDGYKSLDDLIKNSDLVIHCTIKKQREHEAGFSIISTLNTINIISGDVDKSEIDVLQIKGDNILNEKEEYILFLGKQVDNSNEYYIVGYGTQGIFTIDDNKIKPVDEIMKSEYNNLSLESTNSQSKSSNEIDSFINYIENIYN